MPEINSTDLVDSQVLSREGECVARIEELLIDPFSGIVKSLVVTDSAGRSLTLPWSAILYDKTRRAFMLTPKADLALKVH